MAGRRLYHASRVAIDLAVLALAFGAAFGIRFDLAVPAPMLERALVALPFVLALQYLALHLFEVPRFAWRHVGLTEAERILEAILVATVALATVRAVSGAVVEQVPFARFGVLPYGVLLIDAGLAFGGVTGVRVARRIMAERAARRRRASGATPRRTLLIGAGQAGALVAREVQARPDLGFEVVGFLDDDPLKLGSLVQALPVLGALDDLRRLVEQHRIEQALITIPSAAGPVIRRIMTACEGAGLPAKTVPGLHELVGGEVNLVSRIRPVSIDDLLRREEVALDVESIAGLVRGRVVLVTGAGGSIGGELCRQLAAFGPARLVCLDQAEGPLFAIDVELRERHPALALDPRVADVTDEARIEALFEELGPSLVFHAAAHKHVPMMEKNPGEAVKTNVLGTRVMADVAHRHGTDVFVLLSTDKAVHPSSVMGATKRVAELYVQALAERSRTRFVSVRFGNVLGSNGSVVPTFQAQIARGGPVTITHPDMTRYFMTIPEACRLVIQAASMGAGGETFVLDMGEPVRIVDLARDLITLSGLVPEVDIKLEVVGARPGEKLHERLLLDHERADRTRHPKILVGCGAARSWDEMAAAVERLRGMADASPEAIRQELGVVVPEYRWSGPASGAHRKPAGAST